MNLCVVAHWCYRPQASSQEEEQSWSKTIYEWQNVNNIQNPLDPLLKKLIKGYVDDTDLMMKLQALFHRLDENHDG